jgi:hypothetical protein
MQAVIQAKVGMIAIIAGIVGALFGVGIVEASETGQQLIAGIGISVTSCMLMFIGTVLVKEA